MASQTTKVDQYKLDTLFLEGAVVHPTTWTREHKLGTGGFGMVYRERDQQTGRFRAVKVLSKFQLNVRELEALIELQDHPTLFVVFLGWFEDPHATYIAMEYAEHGDLAQYLENHADKALVEAKDITRQILNGLVVMHQRDICHRDLKPQNILVMSLSPIWVKITDFGIAKPTSGTSLRTACGTSCYQAPEVLGLLPRALRPSRTNSYSNIVDIWALGAVVHKILTSEIPFLDKDEESMTSGIESDYATSIEMDIGLLSDYCRKSQPFPTESLLTHEASVYAIDLVKSMMVADPRGRTSAVEALNSRWLTETEAEALNSRQLTETEAQALNSTETEAQALNSRRLTETHPERVKSPSKPLVILILSAILRVYY